MEMIARLQAITGQNDTHPLPTLKAAVNREGKKGTRVKFI